MSEGNSFIVRQITRQLAENKKKMEELESRIDNIVLICKQANLKIPPEITDALSDSLKKTRSIEYHH